MPTTKQIDVAEVAAVKMFGGKPGILGIGVIKSNEEFMIKINVAKNIAIRDLRAIPNSIEGVRVKISKLNPISIENKQLNGNSIAR